MPVYLPHDCDSLLVFRVIGYASLAVMPSKAAAGYSGFKVPLENIAPLR